jgi:hypothetical protein
LSVAISVRGARENRFRCNRDLAIKTCQTIFKLPKEMTASELVKTATVKGDLS